MRYIGVGRTITLGHRTCILVLDIVVLVTMTDQTSASTGSKERKGNEGNFWKDLETRSDRTEAAPEIIKELWNSWIMMKEKVRNYAFFTTKCSVCSRLVYYNSTDEDWETKVKPELIKAFGNWIHGECDSKSSI